MHSFLSTSTQQMKKVASPTSDTSFYTIAFKCTLFFLLIIEILPRSLKYCILSCNLQKCGIFLPRNYIMSHCIQLNQKTCDINHGGNFEAKSIFKIHQKNHWWLELSARGKKCFMKTASIIRLLYELKSL